MVFSPEASGVRLDERDDVGGGGHQKNNEIIRNELK